VLSPLTLEPAGEAMASRILVYPNLDSKKRMHVVHLDFGYKSQQALECIAEENNFNFKDISNLVCDQ
jgi:hypothetical protein